MKLSIRDGALYADNLFFSYCEVTHGSDSLQPGRYEVEARYSHHHRQDLPHVDGIGWIGPANARTDTPCSLVLGRVRGRHAVVPCPTFVVRLLAMLEAADERGSSVSLVIENAAA